MQVSSAYLLVVLVWSTTPLAIHMSNSSLSFVSAITARMILALIICFALLKLFREPLIKSRADWLVYAASAVGLFPNMLLIYWAAQFIPSGLMSVLMGIYPFFVGIFSIFFLRENPFNATKIVALCLALVGLGVIHREQLLLGGDAIPGLLVMILVCVNWGVSTVLVKKLAGNVSPLRQGTGSLVVALPFFIVAWLLLDGEIPEDVGSTSIYGVLYLVFMGSVVSHTLWFYVLRECSAASVSLVTLITPVLAMTWGAFFAGEQFTATTVAGAVIIVVALLLYQSIHKHAWCKLRRILNGRVRVWLKGGGDKRPPAQSIAVSCSENPH